MSKLHHLRTWPEYYEAIDTGDKPFEVRENDRDFQTGDLLNLYEWDQRDKKTTGRECYRRITYVLTGGRFGIEPGYCVLGIRPIDQIEVLEILQKKHATS